MLSSAYTLISTFFRKSALASLILSAWILLSVIGPAFVHQEDEGFFPAIIPYNSTSIDFKNANTIGPFADQSVSSAYYRHWLGTDELGHDVLAQLIYGSKTALLIGVLSVLLSAIVGIFLGSTAAYFGDNGLKLKRNKAIFSSTIQLIVLIYLIFVWPWAYVSSYSTVIAIIASIALSVILWKWTLVPNNRTIKSISVPFDLLVGRLIEAMDSLPILFIIVSLSAILKPSIFGVILIIGLSNWASIARYARAESLKIKNLDYIESARAMGIPQKRIIFSHILPNALPPVFITLAFGVAASILIEATLSFLGMGISVEEASWGSMLAEARRFPEAWWLAIFPGLAIFLVVYSCNKLGEALSKNN